jgi:[ribosomal protein S5]-alanine N-acetyltransferase
MRLGDRSTVLRTSRLTLRRAVMEDVEAFHRVFSNPTAMSYWSTLPHTTLAETTQWVADMIAATDDGLSEDFVVECDGRVIGKAGFWRPPEIGYILHPDYWGRGLATETIQALLSHAFGPMALQKVTADVDPRNQASLRLLARHGFTETARASKTWKIGEVWADSVYLALDRPAYAAARAIAASSASSASSGVSTAI